MGLFGSLFGKKEENNEQDSNEPQWSGLHSMGDLDEAIKLSNETPVVLFKHSTRCSISSSALSRITRNWNNSEVAVQPFILDLISYRDISAAIGTKLNVIHQSPQMIIVKNGKAVFNSSHMDINFSDVKEHAPA